MKRKILFLMAMLCLVCGRVGAYNWTGNTVSTSSEGFYLYNVGFKAFLKSDGSMQENPDDASKWVFDSTTEGKIHCGGQYMYFYYDWGSYKAGVKDNGNEGGITYPSHKTTMTIATGTTSGSYHFSYDPATADVRYFNIDASSGNMTAAKTTGADNDWLLITQAQVDEYNKQAESWHNATVAAGDYYLYNPFFGKYLGVSGDNDEYVTLVEGTANAKPFTVAKSGSAYTLENGGKYLYDKKGSDFGLNRSSAAWTFTAKLGGYQIHGKHNDNDRYIYGTAENNVYLNKGGNFDNIKTSIWVLISAEEFNQKSESANVTLKVGAGKYGTFCAPFAVTIPEGVEVYTVNSVDATNAVQMTQIAGSTIDAKTPVLIYSANGKEQNYTGFKGSDNTCEKDLLVGLLNNTAVPEGAYILTTVDGVQKFRRLTNNSNGVAYRCYLNWDGPEAKLLNITEAATAIDAISALVSNEFDAIYTANGAKVNSLQKGLNLVKMADGSVKKIMVK